MDRTDQYLLGCEDGGGRLALVIVCGHVGRQEQGGRGVSKSWDNC